MKIISSLIPVFTLILGYGLNELSSYCKLHRQEKKQLENDKKQAIIKMLFYISSIKSLQKREYEYRIEYTFNWTVFKQELFTDADKPYSQANLYQIKGHEVNEKIINLVAQLGRV